MNVPQQWLGPPRRTLRKPRPVQRIPARTLRKRRGQPKLPRFSDLELLAWADPKLRSGSPDPGGYPELSSGPAPGGGYP